MYINKQIEIFYHSLKPSLGCGQHIWYGFVTDSNNFSVDIWALKEQTMLNSLFGGQRIKTTKVCWTHATYITTAEDTTNQNQRIFGKHLEWNYWIIFKQLQSREGKQHMELEE